MKILHSPLPCQALTPGHAFASVPLTIDLRNRFIEEMTRINKSRSMRIYGASRWDISNALPEHYITAFRAITFAYRIDNAKSCKVAIPNAFYQAYRTERGAGKFYSCEHIKQSIAFFPIFGKYSDEFSYTEAKAREIKVTLTPELREIAREIYALKNKAKRDDLVYLIDGSKWTPDDRKECAVIRSGAVSEEIRVYGKDEISAYVSEIPDEIYSRYDDKAQKILETLENKLNSGLKGDKLKKALEYRDQLIGLSEQGTRPVLFRNKGRGRVFAEGTSLQNISKTLRRKILFDASEIDIASCHMSIVFSMVPGLEGIRSDLDNDSLYETIANSAESTLKRPLNHANKRQLIKNTKVAVNAMINGAGEKTLSKAIIADLKLKYPAAFCRAWKEVPVVKRIRECVQEFTRSIHEKQGAFLSNGAWLSLDDTKKTYETTVNNLTLAVRVFSALLNDIESTLMISIYRWARDNADKMMIVSHEHDGFSYITFDNDAHDGLQSAMNEVIAATAKQIAQKMNNSREMNISLVIKNKSNIVAVKPAAINENAANSDIQKVAEIPAPQNAPAIPENPSVPTGSGPIGINHPPAPLSVRLPVAYAAIHNKMRISLSEIANSIKRSAERIADTMLSNRKLIL